jgi:hypothetical protein
MCILCGGACGGAGDSVMPLLAAGAGILVLKVRATAAARKMKNVDAVEDRRTEGESPSERTDLGS